MKLSSVQHKAGKSSRESAALTPLKTARLLADLVLLDPGSMGRFRKRWSKLYQRYSDTELLKRRDELRYLWHQVAPSRPFLHIENLFRHTEHTERLENDYGYSGAPDRGVRLPQFICEHWLRSEKDGLYVDWRARQIKARPTSLTTVLAIGCLYHSPYLRICQNSDCAVRYFIAARKDQKYCSPECAEPAKLEAKRKWWNANRSTKSMSSETRSENVTHKTQ
jgi:hypothetical protein